MYYYLPFTVAAACAALWLLGFIWFFSVCTKCSTPSDETRVKLPSPSSSPPHSTPTLQPASWDLSYTNSGAFFPYPDSLCQVCQAVHQRILLIFLLVQSLLLRGIFVLPISRVCTCYTFWMSALSYPSSSNSSPRPLFPTATATGAGKSLYVCMCVRALKCMKQVLSRSLLRS